MIIYYLNLFWSGISPSEDNTPLVVDANRMKARELTFKGFETVARRDGKVSEGISLIHLNQFPQRNSRYSGKPSVAFRPEKFFGVLIRK